MRWWLVEVEAAIALAAGLISHFGFWSLVSAA
jgi:hypothetical protein